MVKPSPEIEDQLEVLMVAIHHPDQTFLTRGIAFYGFQGFFLMLFLCGPDMSIEIFTRLVKFVRIVPQRKIIPCTVIELAEHGVCLPFQRKLRAKGHLRITIKILLTLDEFLRGWFEVNSFLQLLPLHSTGKSHFASYLLKKIIEQYGMYFFRMPVPH